MKKIMIQFRMKFDLNFFYNRETKKIDILHQQTGLRISLGMKKFLFYV